MLAHEWRELEVLGERVGELRTRLDAAQKTGNTGLIEGLNAEIGPADPAAQAAGAAHLGAARFGRRRPPARLQTRATTCAAGGSREAGHTSALMPARD